MIPFPTARGKKPETEKIPEIASFSDFSRFDDNDDAEIVLRPHHSGARIRAIDLILRLAPFRVINAVDPLLRLDSDASEFRHDGRRARRVPLALFDGDGAVPAVAGVDLHALLVGLDGELDAGLGGGERCDA